MHLTKASLLTTAGAAVLLLLHGTPQAAGQDIRNERLKIVAGDGAPGDVFGASVAISGPIAIVGAIGDGDNGAASGSAYLFNVATGTQMAKLLPRDGAALDSFGLSVAISGTTAIVGASGDDDNGTNSGSAYLFDVATGRQFAKLLPSGGSKEDLFGHSVAISGTTAIVGAFLDDDNGTDSGSAYLFDLATSSQIAKLLASDGAEDDNFGHSVAISGPTAIVGAHLDDDNGFNSGSAYFYDVATGTQTDKVLPSDQFDHQYFGHSVAISGSTAIVGAYGAHDNGSLSGSAYLFDVATGTTIAKLLPSDGAAYDRFGYFVAISGSIAIVGAKDDDDNGAESGSAYLFDVATGTQIVKLLPSDGSAEDNFGLSVAIGGTTAIVGALWDDDILQNSGSAYLFDTKNLTLDFAGDCPGPGVFTVTNATPSGPVAIAYGFGAGPVTIPNFNPCAGTLLNVGHPRLGSRIVSADTNGVAILNTNLPPAACDQLRVQALDLATCETSEVVRQ